MNGAITTIQAPSIEPVTAAEVKLYTRITGTDEDDLINGWIKTGRELAEGYQRRAYIGQILELSLDSFPHMPLMVPRAPFMQLISIKYYDYEDNVATLYYDGTNPVSTTEEGGDEPATNADFIIDTSSEPGRIDLAWGVSWPTVTLRSIDAVKIRFACGSGLERSDIPDSVRDAIMLYCAGRYENRIAEDNSFMQKFYDLLRPDRVHL